MSPSTIIHAYQRHLSPVHTERIVARVDVTAFGHAYYWTRRQCSRNSNKFDFDATRSVRCERSLSLTSVRFDA